MSELVWLASYPKSGNTWFRLLLDVALSPPGSVLDINRLQLRHRLASAREPIDELSLLDTRLLTHEEAAWLRPGVYEAFARGAFTEFGEPTPLHWPGVMKIHDAYRTLPDGRALFGAARAAILIVRDPRAIAPSLASFYGRPIEVAIDQMASPDEALSRKIDGAATQVLQSLSDWSGHAASWLDQRDMPVHLVRYEDLVSDTLNVFLDAGRSIGLPLDEACARRAVEATAFETLQAQERAAGFGEFKRRQVEGAAFFRRGQADAWRDELTDAHIARLEADHGKMMDRLGYPRLFGRSDG